MVSVEPSDGKFHMEALWKSGGNAAMANLTTPACTFDKKKIDMEHEHGFYRRNSDLEPRTSQPVMFLVDTANQ